MNLILIAILGALFFWAALFQFFTHTKKSVSEEKGTARKAVSGQIELTLYQLAPLFVVPVATVFVFLGPNASNLMLEMEGKIFALIFLLLSLLSFHFFFRGLRGKE